MFGIWKPTDRPIKLQCRIKSEIEHLLPALTVFFVTLGIASFLIWKLGIVDFLKYAVIAILGMAAIIVGALILAWVVAFLFKNTVGRLWNRACGVANLSGYQKAKAELAVAEAGLTGFLAIMALLLVTVFILAVLNAGLWSLFEAIVVWVICAVIVIGGIALAIVAYKVISYLWEKFWVTLGCPTKEEKEALKRKWEEDKWEARRAEMLRHLEEEEKKANNGGV